MVPYRVAEQIGTLKLILFGISDVPDKGGAWFFEHRDQPAVVRRLFTGNNQRDIDRSYALPSVQASMG
jgi:hypothetical protein